MSAFLERILDARRGEVERLRRAADELDARAAGASPPRDFAGALRADGMSLIAEIKRRSPSKGDLAPGIDPAGLARVYEGAGARAISVLTEPDFFAGSPDDLAAARGASAVPVLWKDFVLDPVQVALARATGADAVLLIVRVLGPRLDDLLRACERHGVAALVEVFDEADLDAALSSGARIVGVNHRDLETFDEDPTATLRLRPLVPDDVVLVAESAISTRSDVEALEAAGVHAMLVGEAIVTSGDPAAKIRELLG